MSRSYDIDHTGSDAKRALRAIIARVKRDWTDPDLVSFGQPLELIERDILRIAESVDTEVDDDNE